MKTTIVVIVIFAICLVLKIFFDLKSTGFFDKFKKEKYEDRKPSNVARIKDNQRDEGLK